MAIENTAAVDPTAGVQNIIETVKALIAEKGVSLLGEVAGRVLGAFAIFIIGRWVAKAVGGGVKKLLLNRNVDKTLVLFVSKVLYVLVMTFVILAVLEVLCVKTTGAIAVLGAAGLAVGFALQGSLANLAAGILMIIFRPFRAGDFVETAGVKGVVNEVGIFTTRLTTPDNKSVIIPNGKVTGDNIVNYSATGTRRVDLVVGVSYADDLDKVRQVTKSVLSADERILKEPEPTIAVLELGDSSVNFAVRPWVNTADYWDVYFDTLENLKKRFDSEGITIPFPQRDVHLYEEKGEVG
jgi:small conductance mechanosensitive channel